MIFIVGIHKHIIILQLQNEICQRTRVWIEVVDLWGRLKEMYNLDGIRHNVGCSITRSFTEENVK